MNAEGIGLAISPEWILALLSAVPVLVVAVWLLLATSGLQRRAVWVAISQGLAELQEQLGGEVRPRWSGVRLQADEVRIDWVSGLFGPRTRVRVGGRSRKSQGLLIGDGLLAVLDAIKREGR